MEADGPTGLPLTQAPATPPPAPRCPACGSHAVLAGQRACPSCGLPFPAPPSAVATAPPPRSRRQLLVAVFGAAVAAIALVSVLVLRSGPPGLEPRWRLQAGGAVVGTAEVDGGTLFVATRQGSLVAVEAESGQAQWRFEAGARILAPPVADGGLVHVATEGPGSSPGQVFSVDARTGTEQWRAQLDAPLAGPPAVAAGLVILPAGDVVALDALTGEERWRQTVGSGALLVAEAEVVVATGLGELVALDAATGAERWRVRAPVSSQMAPVLARGTLVAADGAGALVGRDVDDGSERWRVPDLGSVQAVVTAGQLVVLATTDGVVALDNMSGERRWLGPMVTAATDRDGGAALVATDGAEIAVVSAGRLFLLDGVSGEVLGEADLAGESRATPTVAAGRAYVAEGETIAAFDRPAA